MIDFDVRKIVARYLWDRDNNPPPWRNGQMASTLPTGKRPARGAIYGLYDPRYKNGVTQTALAAEYGVSLSNVGAIVHNKTWRKYD
jgi:hypothetical protein